MVIRFRMCNQGKQFIQVTRWEDYLRLYPLSHPLFHLFLLPSLKNILLHINGILILVHASLGKLHSLLSIGTLNNVSKFSFFYCIHCKLAKQPTISYSTSNNVHSNIWSQHSTLTVKDYWYFMLLIDDHSCFTWIYLYKHHCSLPHIYIVFLNMVCTQFYKSLKIFYTDNAMEYKDSHLLCFHSHQGTLVQHWRPYTTLHKMVKLDKNIVISLTLSMSNFSLLRFEKF